MAKIFSTNYPVNSRENRTFFLLFFTFRKAIFLSAFVIFQQYKSQYGYSRAIDTAIPFTTTPEGGWYKETYKSEEGIAANALPARFSGNRAFSTAIYFLLQEGQFSAFHRIQSDECWHFYMGGPLHIYIINQQGKLEIIVLGNQFTKGQLFQFVVPANCWFASRPAPESGFCLTGCTVAPGFDFADFEMATAVSLTEMYPQHADIIRQLCR